MNVIHHKSAIRKRKRCLWSWVFHSSLGVENMQLGNFGWLKSPLSYTDETCKYFSISLISCSFCVGFHITVINATGKLLEKLESETICISIFMHTYQWGLCLLECIYTHMVSWLYLYYIKNKAKFEGVQCIVACTTPPAKDEKLTSFWAY